MKLVKTGHEEEREPNPERYLLLGYPYNAFTTHREKRTKSNGKSEEVRVKRLSGSGKKRKGSGTTSVEYHSTTMKLTERVFKAFTIQKWLQRGEGPGA